MGYTDYRTGKSISREQYIKNGIERGRLIAVELCGCVVINDRTGGAYIVYCPMHLAAPKMLEALKLYQKHQQGTSGHYCSDCANVIEQAIALAEPKEEK